MSPREKRIVGLGNALVDVVTSVEPAAVARHALTPGGMHLVGREAAEALYAEVGPGLQKSGGSVANTIAHLATEVRTVPSSARSPMTPSAPCSGTV